MRSKKVFFILENNYFQSHESHQLSTKIRTLAHLWFHEKTMKPVIRQEISNDKKDKVKTTVKHKIKNSNKFFEKVVSKPLKA